MIRKGQGVRLVEQAAARAELLEQSEAELREREQPKMTLMPLVPCQGLLLE